MRDTYGIEIEPGQDDVLVLAIVVALDTMEHDEPGRSRRAFWMYLIAAFFVPPFQFLLRSAVDLSGALELRGAGTPTD